MWYLESEPGLTTVDTHLPVLWNAFHKKKKEKFRTVIFTLPKPVI